MRENKDVSCGVLEKQVWQSNPNVFIMDMKPTLVKESFGIKNRRVFITNEN